MLTKKLIAFALGFLIMISTHGQKPTAQDTIRPEVGKPMPDFTLNHITHYKTKKASLKDFKGKWLVLDFWSSTCSSCIRKFPEVNAYHNAFKSELNWILVGKNDLRENKGIEALYEKYRLKRNLEMVSAYDSVLVNLWEINMFPYIIIIDPTNIVRYVGDGRDFTASKLRDFLDGKVVNFWKRPKRVNFEAEKLTENSESDNLLYRSVLAKWNGERQVPMEIKRWTTWPEELLKKGYTLSMIPLYMLYNYAFIGNASWGCEDTLHFGKYYPRPILELKDASAFQYDFINNVGSGTYNYNLTLPVEQISEDMIMKTLQHDLEAAFGYQASVETRTMPVWKLVSEPGAVEKIKTKGGKRFFSPGTYVAGYTLRNVPREYFIGSISSSLQETLINAVFVDETGLKGNFDFTLQADMTDLGEVQKALRKQGFDLVKETKELKVIVIRENLSFKEGIGK